MSKSTTPSLWQRLMATQNARITFILAWVVITSYLVVATPRQLAFGLATQAVFILFAGSVLWLYYLQIPNALKVVIGFLVLGVLIPVFGGLNQYYLEVATQVCIFSALALGLNIVVGFAGLLDLGYVAFYLVGAYTWAIFGSPQAQKFIPPELLKFPLAQEFFFPFFFLATFLAALTGIMLGLPVLRVRGDYLAVVTLGFGELLRVVANNLDKPVNITNGPQGITPIQRPPLFFRSWFEGFGTALHGASTGLPLGLDKVFGGIGSWMENANPAQLYPIYFYFLVLLVIAIVIFVSRRVSDSRIGRAWEAVREDEDAAVAMGIPIVTTKLAAFATGASFAGAMGMLFAAKQVFINPESFTFLESIGVLAMVIVGGMGSIPGVVLGATALTVLNLQILPNISLALNSIRQAGYVIPVINYNLAQLPSQFEPAKYQRMVFGLVLIVMMLVRPEGLLPAKRRRVEIHQDKEVEAIV
ncbi:MAG: branched-chain amino acid ABC transporter permease [Chloroflexi bacterium]|nr:branched-chain amino acid ABC transporter permease [Chloroflexota bacterium]